jgi:hypothetical protein
LSREALVVDTYILDSQAPPPVRRAGSDWIGELAHVGAQRTFIFRTLLARLPGPGVRLVDLGAGPCIFSRIARDAGYAVTAVDGRTVRKPADEDLGTIRFVHSDVRDFGLDGFDVIAFLGLLYHFDLPDQMRVLRACARTGAPVILETQVHVDGLVPEAQQGEWARTVVGRGDYEGLLFPEGSNPMASVGNPVSFWPTEPSLLKMLADAGFNSVALVEPLLQSKYGARRFYLLNCEQAALRSAGLPDATLAAAQLKLVQWVGAGRYDDARRLFHQIPSDGTVVSDPRYGLAVARLQLHFGERDQAAATVRRLRDSVLEQADPVLPVVLACAGVLQEAGEAGEADETRRAALDRIQSPEAARSLIQWLVAYGSVVNARLVMAHAEDRFGGSSELLGFLAQTHQARGDLDDAERVRRLASPTPRDGAAGLQGTRREPLSGAGRNGGRGWD